jgi:4-amino-4-deoxy-L-arabinose transferase-like glycosyltransferase
VWAGVVIVFFSVSQGKLPGYLLPAFPALAMWMGEEWRRASIIRLRAVAVAQGLLLLLLSLADSLPSILARGLRRAELQFSAGGVCFALGSVVLVWMAWRGRRLGAAVLAGVLTAVALVWIVHTVAPGVDAANSMRGVARQVCGKPFAVWEVRRQVRYGLEFYCDRPMTEAVAADLVLSTQHPPGMTREQEFQEARLSLWKR